MSDARATRAAGTAPSLRVLIGSVGWLTLVIVPAAVLVAYLQTMAFTTNTVLVAAAGGAICWIAGALALTVTWLGNCLAMPVQGVLGAMLFRLGIPLVSVVAAPQLEGILGVSGMATTILGVYLIALIAETALSLRMVPQMPLGARPV